MDRRRIPHESGEVSCARLPDAIGEFVRSSDAGRGSREVERAYGPNTQAASRASKGLWRSLHCTFLLYRSTKRNTSHKRLCARLVAMPCKSYGSLNQSKFCGETAIHFPGLKNIDKPIVWVFPEVVVCLDCGTAEFALTEADLRQLAKSDAAAPG